MCSIDPKQLPADARDLVNRVEPDRQLQAEALALACHLNHLSTTVFIWPLPGGKQRP